MTLRELPADLVPDPRPQPGPEEYSAMQALTRELAFDPEGWTPERLARTGQLFDGLAPEWHTRNEPERLLPLRDAQQRGGIPAGGSCLEIGSGIGLQTPSLLEHFDSVVSMDLSAEMLGRSPQVAGVSLVRADASRLPVSASSVGAVALVNMFLFPSECARVLRPGGRLIFVSTSGDRTPIYLPPADVVRALQPMLGPCDAVTAGAGWGVWTVVTKA